MSRDKPCIDWSKEDDAILFEKCLARRKGDGMVWVAIAENFPGRTVAACKHRFDRLQLIRAGKAPAQSYRHRKINPRYVKHLAEDLALKQNPIHLPPPHSITAWICGDPLPGRSALDHKRLEESRA